LSRIVAGTNLWDGLLELFVIGPDSFVYHKKQINDNKWGEWRVLSTYSREETKGRVKDKFTNELMDNRAKDIALYISKEKIELFMIGIDDGIYCCYQENKKPWNKWEEQELTLYSDIFLDLIDRKKELKVLNVFRRHEEPQKALEIFYIYSNDLIFYHRRTDSGWSKGKAIAGPAKTFTIANQKLVEGFSYETDLALFFISSESSPKLGNVLICNTSDPNPYTNSDPFKVGIKPRIPYKNKKGINIALGKMEDRLELFVIGDKDKSGEINNIWHFRQNKECEWDSELEAEYFEYITYIPKLEHFPILGDRYVNVPVTNMMKAIDFAVGLNKPSTEEGNLELITLDDDNDIWPIFQRETNICWYSVIDVFSDFFNRPKAKEIAMCVDSDGLLHLFTIGIDDEVYHFNRDSSSGNGNNKQSMELNPYGGENIQTMW